MKKLLTILFGALVALSLFVTTGNTAKAEGFEITSADEDCTCHNVIPIVGAEKNKIIASLLSSQQFKNARITLKNENFTSKGVSEAQVFYNYTWDVTIVGLPVISNDGTVMMATFINGFYMGNAPLDE